MNEKLMKCALIGEKLSHSYSPEIHSSLGKEYSYRLIEIGREELEKFFTERDFDAINVTIPYKKECMPYLDFISDEARGVGAVNTVVNRRGKLSGYNTDVFGIADSFRRAGVSPENKKVLVLGTGGASLAAIYYLSSNGAEVINVSRTKKEGCVTYEELSSHRDAKIIVNATPAGMYPNIDSSPLTLSGNFDSLEFVFDMIYNPFRTKLLLEACSLNIKCMNGLFMLTAQAAKAAEYFTDEKIPSEKVDFAYSEVLKKCITLSLIGMPGSGKSTVGKLLAASLSLDFTDADDYFEEKFGISPADAIKTLGESKFRDMEEECICECTRKHGILATGGGAVLREGNREALRAFGPVFEIRRNLSSLDTEGRPLSQGKSLEELYRVRKSYYDACADFYAENTEPTVASEKIKETLSNIIYFGDIEK